jgi:large subunit ribosomal protein L13
MMKTYSPKPAELTHEWFLIDAEGITLGRLATRVATLLLGKHKPQYAPHIDCGDNVVVINVEKIAVTGSKLTDKHYYHHSGYPGGIRSRSLEEMLARNPALVIEHAVSGMLPKNRLQDDRLRRLKLFAGPEHKHAGQNPKPMEVK